MPDRIYSRTTVVCRALAIFLLTLAAGLLLALALICPGQVIAWSLQ